MQLKFTDELADKLEMIFGAQPKPFPFYRWCVEINEQFLYVEEVMKGRGYEFDVVGVRQNCHNLHISLKADPDEISAIDANLLREQTIKGYTHCLVLEHKE